MEKLTFRKMLKSSNYSFCFDIKIESIEAYFIKFKVLTVFQILFSYNLKIFSRSI